MTTDLLVKHVGANRNEMIRYPTEGVDPMSFPNEIELLTREIEREEASYLTSILLETEIMEAIAEGEFAPTIRRTRLLASQRALAERIRRNKIMRAWAQK